MDSRNGTRVDFYKTIDDVAIDAVPYIDVTDREWHLLTFTFDNTSSNLNLYIDGVLEGSATNSFMSSAADRALVFGARDDGSRGESILIDTIQFYNEALTPLEVEVLYTGDYQVFQAKFMPDLMISNGVVNLAFSGTTGQHYRLEYIDSLTSSNGWQAVTDMVSLVASTAEVFAPITNRTGFYRMIWIP
ncbi:hypothetical protein P4C99_07075 [Pontiellaceae bacterium B1224]|nr:hypothetical protein [Pontiellaceae bacterium B1224]